MTPELIEEIVLRALHTHNENKAEVHCSHCEWIQEHIEMEARRKELFMEAAKAIAQYSVLGLLGAFGYWIKGHVQW